VDHPVDVDVERPPPIIELVLPERSLGPGTDAGVVAEEVDGAVALHGRVAQPLHRRIVGDVADHPGGLKTFGPELLGRRDQRRLFDIGQDHLHPLAGEALAHGSTDAPGTAGDHCHPAGQVLHHSSPTGERSS
jgi:hypothetical protein